MTKKGLTLAEKFFLEYLTYNSSECYLWHKTAPFFDQYREQSLGIRGKDYRIVCSILPFMKIC